MRTLAQLVHWGAGMAVAGLLLVVLLESTRGDPRVLDFSDYMKVLHVCACMCPTRSPNLR